MVCGGGDEARLHVDGLRHEQRLSYPAAGSQPFQQPVVEHSLVSRVLVDEHKTFGALGHQVSRPDLSDRPEHVLGGAGSDLRDSDRSRGLMEGELRHRVASHRGGNTGGGVILVRLAAS